jgi:hypothetical protein
MVNVIQKKFAEADSDQEPAGWETDITNQYLFVIDRKTNLWNLYFLNGELLLNDQKGYKDSKFLYYSPKSKKVYFLILESEKRTTIKTVDIQ